MLCTAIPLICAAKANQLRNNIGGTAADNHKASDSSNGTIN